MHERQDGHFGGTGDSSAPRALVGNQGPQGSKGPRGEPGNKGVFQGPRGEAGNPGHPRALGGTPELPAPNDQPIPGTTTTRNCHIFFQKPLCLLDVTLGCLKQSVKIWIGPYLVKRASSGLVETHFFCKASGSICAYEVCKALFGFRRQP